MFTSKMRAENRGTQGWHESEVLIGAQEKRTRKTWTSEKNANVKSYAVIWLANSLTGSDARPQLDASQELQRMPATS